MSPDVSAASLPRCANHPEAPAEATCQRCGSFVCTPCSTWVLSELFCPACAARPEVNYLETFRLKLWGRRDPWTYLVAAFSLVLAGAGVYTFSEGAVVVPPVLLGFSLLGVPFFLGMKGARFALLLAPVVAAAILVPIVGAPVLALALLPFLVALQIFLDPRNRLFFRIDIPEHDLRKLWDLHANNPIARHAFTVGVGSVFMPVLAPLAVILGLIGLRRVDLQARPPIGRRGQAIAGIVLGLGSVALWGMFLAPLLRDAFYGFVGV